MNRKAFFDHVRAEPFGGALTASQVDGMTRILDEAERRAAGDVRILAYRLATTFHETGKAMVPVREGGGEAYLESKPYYPWVGEGLIQVTWRANAEKFGATKPGDCMSWPVALRALFDGMDEGVFTGRKVGTYFTATIDDPVGARHVINGTDKAALIATYHAHFLAALKAAAGSPAAPAQVAAAAPSAPSAPAGCPVVVTPARPSLAGRIFHSLFG